jgi:DNA-binding transcriptional LysR family regulator
MSLAANELHMTQPGVSQHIKALEQELSVKLFDRINQRIVATAAARDLFGQCEKSLSELGSVLYDIQGAKTLFQGTLCIGMPIEFGNNKVLPLISEFAAQHPRLQFKFTLGYASEMIEGLTNGMMDFAFVDEVDLDSRIEQKPVFVEELELFASHKIVLPRTKLRDWLTAQPFVDYQNDLPLLTRWFRHHFQKSQSPELNCRAVVMDVRSVAQLIHQGLGLGVLPSYMIPVFAKEGQKLQIIKASGRSLRNQISLAHLKGRAHSLAANSLMKFFRERLL